MARALRALVVAMTILTAALFSAPPSSARAAWDTTPVHMSRQVAPTPHVVDLRVAEHATYDRVVIDLTGPIPGYDVRYVDHLWYDPSGKSVPLSGTRFIAIRLTSATAHDAQGRNVYQGPRLQQLSMSMLRGVALTGDYEGTVSFGLALSHLDSFRVLEVHRPNRVVIDVHH